MTGEPAPADVPRVEYCPDCDEPSVLVRSGYLPWCSNCDWTGWDVTP
jgi:hypothetical protein